MTYRYGLFRPLVVAAFAGLSFGAITLVVTLLRGADQPGPVFSLLWLGTYAWNAYWWLYRVVYELGVGDGSILQWRAVLRRGHVPAASIMGVRPLRLPGGSGIAVIEIAGRRPLLTVIASGFDDVVAMLESVRPGLPVRITWYGRLTQAMSWPRSWGWRRRA